MTTTNNDTVEWDAARATAQSLTDDALAQRLWMIHDNRRAFPPTQTDALLSEAARRLRWGRRSERCQVCGRLSPTSSVHDVCRS